ncbi:MAG: autoinducer 2 ABC transporter substrate-binding protein [Candidatus Humimicrobiaceae bacterium]
MKKRVSWFLVVAMCISVIAVFLLAGCKTSAAETTAAAAETTAAAAETTAAAAETTAAAKSSKVWEIVDIPKLSPHPYFDRGLVGLKKANVDFGINAYQNGAVDADSVAQVGIVNDLIAKKVDAILACALDPNAFVPVLKRAMDAGILTMSYSSPVEESAITWDVRSLDDKEYAEHMLDKLVEFMGSDSAEYVVLTGQIDTPDHLIWFNYIKEYAAKKYPNLKLVSDVNIPTEEKAEKAYAITVDLVKTYPNLKGVICLGSGGVPGVALAVEEKGLKLAVVGTGTPQACARGLKNGSLSLASLWDPANISYVTAWVAYMTLEKKEITDGMVVPNLGSKIKVNGKIIIPGSYTDFTADNVDEYQF